MVAVEMGEEQVYFFYVGFLFLEISADGDDAGAGIQDYNIVFIFDEY